MTYHAKVISGGKIVIPAELRRELDIKDGDTLILEGREDGGVSIKTRAQVVQEVRAAFRAMRKPDVDYGNVVDELIAERRAEAARDDDDTAKRR